MSDTSTPTAVRTSLRERGMATVEYALGVVVVIVLVGAIVVAIQTGTFGDLIEQLLGAIVKWITKVFEIPLPSFAPKP